MAGTKGRQPARESKSPTAHHTADRSMQLVYVKPQSVLSVDQKVTVNTYPGLVRAAHQTVTAGSARNSWPHRKEGDYHGRVRDWGEVVTR